MNGVRILNLIIIFFVTYTSREKMLSFRPCYSLVHSRACLVIQMLVYYIDIHRVNHYPVAADTTRQGNYLRCPVDRDLSSG